MDCHITKNDISFDLNKRLGSVFILVEGESPEFYLLTHIFNKVLNYKVLQCKRNQKNIKEICQLKNLETNSNVVILNTKDSSIMSLETSEDYLNNIFVKLYEDFKIDIYESRTYILWDRDRGRDSNTKIKEMLGVYNNSVLNESNYFPGLLLLHYPNIEGFIISNFESSPHKKKIYDTKKYFNESKYKISWINEDTLKRSLINLHKVLKDLGIKKYSTDDFKGENLKIFDSQEEFFNSEAFERILSLACLILIDLQIISLK